MQILVQQLKQQAILKWIDLNVLQQISINSKNCMILEMDKVRGFVNIPVFNYRWNQLFRIKICNQNEQYRKNNTQPNYDYCHDGDEFIDSITDQLNQYQKSVINVQIPDTIHTHYSDFVPLRSGCYSSKNQCEVEIPFLTNLYQKQYNCEKIKLENQILQNADSLQKYKINVKAKYNPFISFTDKVQMYVQLLSYGTQVFSHVSHLHSLIYTLTRLQWIFEQKIKIKKHLSVTIDRQSQINTFTISQTMKSFYCPLCFLYDCTVHNQNHIWKGSSGNYQYVSPKSRISKLDHIKSCLQMLNIESQQNKQRQRCSKQCFLNLQQLQNNMKFKIMLINKQSIMSDVAKALIKIGVQLFSFNPCLIKKLLPDNKVSCSQIYTFLQNQYNARTRLLNKQFTNEQQMLINQQTEQKTKVPKQLVQYARKKKNKATNKNRRNINNHDCNTPDNTQKISICMHHFLNQSSFDQNCRNCVCNQRGYCLPSCLCSDQCLIMKIGCRCAKKGKKLCNTQCCPCYESGVQCEPDVCGKNCSGEQNQCFNQQISQRKFKRVRIGASNLPGAGFGLFAGEDIFKDQLVTVYLGQVVDTFIIELRDKIRKNNSFYNYECKNVQLDSRFMGNESRFINHSNKLQNLRVRTMKAKGQYWIAFYAGKDISKDEQLYIDYDGDGEMAKYHAEKYPFIDPK